MEMTLRCAAMSTRDVLTRGSRVQMLVARAPLPMAWKKRIPPIGDHRLHTPTGESFGYVAHRGDLMARGIVWDDLKTWERRTQEVLCARFLTATEFWDIGAYAGIYSLLACAANPSIKVTAVEPVPGHASWLRSNIEANAWRDRIRVVDAAVSDQPGHADMNVVEADITASGIGVNKPGTIIRVPTVRLDDLGTPPDVIKIDVEGHEVEALSTGREMLHTHSPAIVTECLNEEALTRMFNFLQPFGYELHHIARDGVHHVKRPFTVPGGHANFLAVPAGTMT